MYTTVLNMCYNPGSMALSQCRTQRQQNSELTQMRTRNIYFIVINFKIFDLVDLAPSVFTGSNNKCVFNTTSPWVLFKITCVSTTEGSKTKEETNEHVDQLWMLENELNFYFSVNILSRLHLGLAFHSFLECSFIFSVPLKLCVLCFFTW